MRKDLFRERYESAYRVNFHRAARGGKKAPGRVALPAPYPAYVMGGHFKGDTRKAEDAIGDALHDSLLMAAEENTAMALRPFDMTVVQARSMFGHTFSLLKRYKASPSAIGGRANSQAMFGRVETMSNEEVARAAAPVSYQADIEMQEELVAILAPLDPEVRSVLAHLAAESEPGYARKARRDKIDAEAKLDTCEYQDRIACRAELAEAIAGINRWHKSASRARAKVEEQLMLREASGDSLALKSNPDSRGTSSGNYLPRHYRPGLEWRVEEGVTA